MGVLANDFWAGNAANTKNMGKSLIFLRGLCRAPHEISRAANTSFQKIQIT
jgi:hypothetical protein